MSEVLRGFNNGEKHVKHVRAIIYVTRSDNFGTGETPGHHASGESPCMAADGYGTSTEQGVHSHE